MTAIRPLNRHGFPNAARHFNCAMIGPESVEAAEAAGARVLPDWNEALEKVRHSLAALVGAQKDEVEVFHNTTAAAQRVVSRVGQELGTAPGTLLTTDFEYPGIVAHLDEAWPGRVALAQVADYVWGGQPREAIRRLLETILLCRPTVVYFSHVARASGFVMPTEVIRFLRQVTPKTIIIIDGAQALGNSTVDHELLSLVDFYLACSQKWLCARTTLGFVYARREWRVADPAQGYSKRYGSGGTGSLQALASLCSAIGDFDGTREPLGTTASERLGAIAKHNAALSELFSRELIDSGLGRMVLGAAPDGWVHNGIVALVDGVEESAAALTAEEIEHVIIHQEPLRTHEGRGRHAPRFRVRFTSRSPYSEALAESVDFADVSASVPPLRCLRLAFHYYHSEDHVKRVARLIVEHYKSGRTAAGASRKARPAIARRASRGE